MNNLDQKWIRKYLRWWAVLLIVIFAIHLLPHVSAQAPPCGWTDGPREHQAVDIVLGVAAAGGIVGIFFPPAGIAALVLGGLAGMYGAVLSMSQC